ncbi:MAG: hypothetical protein ACO1TE_00855 [Prosthecobacter sp.]
MPAPEGKVTLWADFAGADEGGHVPLYLVNQTDVPQPFDSQDGDVYIKLEYQDEAGRWRRPRARSGRLPFKLTPPPPQEPVKP